MSNFAVYKRPKTILLRGLTQEDFVIDDGIFDAKFTEGLEIGQSKPTYTVPYNSLPTVFSGFDSWPRTGNLKCWSCTRVTGGIPLFVVDSLVYDGAQRTIVPKGSFCTFNCVQRYINLNYRGVEHDDKTKYNLLMYRELSGERVYVIQPSPPPSQMRAFCGDQGCTEEEYGEQIIKLSAEYNPGNFRFGK
jgi:hypothetical protein